MTLTYYLMFLLGFVWPTLQLIARLHYDIKELEDELKPQSELFDRIYGMCHGLSISEMVRAMDFAGIRTQKDLDDKMESWALFAFYANDHRPDIDGGLIEPILGAETQPFISLTTGFPMLIREMPVIHQPII